MATLTLVGHAHAKVEFQITPHGSGEKITCHRDGILIYELVSIKKDGDSEMRLFEFYWEGKKALQVLKIGTTATISTYPLIAVSYSVNLDSDSELRSVTVADKNGKVIDGLLRKNDGRMWPSDPLPIIDVDGPK